MRIGQVIGTVTLSRFHPSMTGASLKLAVPLALADLNAGPQPESEALVVYDELGAGLGSRVAISEGAEAAQPFQPDLKPIDAYNAAILESIDVDSNIQLA